MHLLCCPGPAGQGSLTDRNVCDHVLLSGMHEGIKAQEGGTLLSDQKSAVCYNKHA